MQRLECCCVHACSAGALPFFADPLCSWSAAGSCDVQRQIGVYPSTDHCSRAQAGPTLASGHGHHMSLVLADTIKGGPPTVPNPGAESTPGDPQPPPNPGFGIGRKLQQSALGEPSQAACWEGSKAEGQRLQSVVFSGCWGASRCLLAETYRGGSGASTHLRLSASKLLKQHACPNQNAASACL